MLDKRLNEIFEQRESKYLMLTLAAKRMRKLLYGEKPLVDTKRGEDLGNVVMRELDENKLKLIARKKTGKVVDLAKQDS